MKQFEHKVQDALGLHARPCSALVMEAKKYQSKITVTYGAKTVDAQSIMGLMTLGVKTGEAITITIEGADEDAVFDAFPAYCKEKV